ncbi:hypothetical protein VDG1235_4681 [Verrucomicrobiia bacterium DG1235]|nr:hypothetical protein VDG1235_4681 [Verrucomicrobiae bacterium DG1235]
MKTLKKIALATTLAAIATSALAHRQWILPSTSILSGEDQWISVEAAISNNLYFPNHHAIALDNITVLGPSGQALEKHSAAQGKIRSTFELQLEANGSYRIFSGRSGMFASWEEDGERKRKRGTAEEFAAMDLASMDKLQLRENASRVETIVTSGAPSEIAVSGKGLEFEFKTHPNDLFTGESASFRVLLNGKPTAGVEVTVVQGNDRFRNEAGDLTFVSGEDGLVEIEWPQAGRYWINASANIAGADFHGIPLKRSASYTLTVEVLPD